MLSELLCLSRHPSVANNCFCHIPCESLVNILPRPMLHNGQPQPIYKSTCSRIQFWCLAYTHFCAYTCSDDSPFVCQYRQYVKRYVNICIQRKNFLKMCSETGSWNRWHLQAMKENSTACAFCSHMPSHTSHLSGSSTSHYGGFNGSSFSLCLPISLSVWEVSLELHQTELPSAHCPAQIEAQLWPIFCQKVPLSNSSLSSIR